jgi:hypothetical protein
MADRQPPRVAGDERAVLLGQLRFHRESFASKLDGLDDAAARSSPVPSGTSLLWLAKHLTFAEHIWLEHRFSRGPLTRSNELAADDTVASVLDTYRSSWPVADAIIEGHELDETLDDPNGGGRNMDLRWVVAHLIGETARHAGHADILRELLDGRTGR